MSGYKGRARVGINSGAYEMPKAKQVTSMAMGEKSQSPNSA